MREKNRVVYPYLFWFFAVLCLLISTSCRQKPSQRKVVLYCSVDQAIAVPIVKAFTEKSGITVQVKYDTEATKTVGLVQRIRADAAAPVADVFWSSEVFHTIRLADESLLASYRSETTKDWPRVFTDPAGRWYGFALRARVIAYHTGKVKAQEAPRSLEDLLEAKWKGRVVMAAPEFGTTGGDVASWFANYGDERAKEILRGLKANEIRLVNGNSTAVRMVATGQADICLTDTDDVYAAQRNDWPVGMNFLDQGGDGTLTIPNTVAMIASAPHQSEAKELIEYLLSEQVERALAQSDSHNSPVNASLADEFKVYTVSSPLKIDYKSVADKLPVAIETAREILR